MEILVAHGEITNVPGDVLIVNLFEGVSTPGGATGAVDSALGGLISQLIASGEIKGKLNETTLIHTHGKIAPKRVLVVGLGKSGDFDLLAVRQAAGSAVRFLRKKSFRQVTTIVHGAGIGGLPPREAAQAVAEASIIADYDPDLYKAEKDSAPLETLTIVEREADRVTLFESGVRTGVILGRATNDARTLGNEPSCVMNPETLSDRARETAERFGLEFGSYDGDWMKAQGMGALLAVASGSVQAPRIMVMRYRSEGASKTLGLIGKGLTFDSGGISIKPSDGMPDMKFDMSGGAAVIQAMRAIAELKPAINVIGIVPAAENMPSGSAYRPGDIIRTKAGKTVEIITTDAEGRMILSDAMAYAKDLGVDFMVDVATLTGACVVALGHDYTGIMGSDPVLVSSVERAAAAAGERVWELPLPPDYMEQLKSEYADLKNCGERWGGAITGGLFLKEFAGDTPWVHMDIAGPADSPKATSYRSAGATGVGVRTLAMLAVGLAEEPV
ncbi:MAG: leucyl aminopeptidase [Armatimonadetes bacterium]|nr:leucyl aminopeptidase [Armatimonadota bacterium]